MKLIYFLLLVSFIGIGCFQDEYTKPMKLNRNGENFSCTAFYEMDELVKIVCFSKDRDTILIDSLWDNASMGKSIRYYNSGELREVGEYTNHKMIGTWKGYFQNGNLKFLRHYKEVGDSIPLYYEKLYKEDGTLDRMMLPIEYRPILTEGGYRVGETYDLYIDLLYSEYDSVNSMLLLEPNPSSGINADTVFYAGRSVYLKFTPQNEGKHSISGIYIEVNGNDPNPDESKVAEKPFRFDYEAVK